jgi:hypothetical protein
MSNYEPQKLGPHFEIRHSLFDILRFKRPAGKSLRMDLFRSGSSQGPPTIKSPALPQDSYFAVSPYRMSRTISLAALGWLIP